MCESCKPIINPEKKKTGPKSKIIRTEFGKVCTSTSCDHLGELQPWSEFTKKKDSPDNYSNRCRSCQSKHRKTKESYPRKTEGTKKCRQCKVEKHVDDMITQARNKDGLGSICRECASKNAGEKNYPRQTEGVAYCYECTQYLHVDNFHSYKRNKNGLESLCKWCSSKLKKKRYADNKEANKGKLVGDFYCKDCDQWKDVSEFHEDPVSATGVRGSCRECVAFRKSLLDYPKQTEGSKECTRCGINKPYTSYHGNHQAKDGLETMCIQCRYEYVQSLDYPRQEEGTKCCTRCKVEKDVGEFSSNRRNQDGLNIYCKNCDSDILQSRDFPRQTEGTKFCSLCGVEQDVSEFFGNRHNCDGLNSRCKTCCYAYVKERMETDLQFKLSIRIRTRTSDAIRKHVKSGSSIDDLGCTVTFLIKYIESQFHPHPITGEEMTWENWSKYGWHLDHYYPLSRLNLSDRDQFLKGIHYTNLKPMWGDINVHLKRNKLPEEWEACKDDLIEEYRLKYEQGFRYYGF